ncbi:MAG: glycosyltransferase, partial [Verrucomicrobiota bacterium]
RLIRPFCERNFNQAVFRHSDNKALDFMLVFKGVGLFPETLQVFRGERIRPYCFYPDVSFLDHGRNIWNCLPLYDCVFTTKTFHVDDINVRSHVKEFCQVAHGFDPEVHRPVELTAQVQAHYGCDVSFVGCWSPKKESQLAAIALGCPGVDLRIWGPGWARAASAVGSRWQRRGAFGDELSIIYGSSKINLGLLSEAGGGTGQGDRVTARTWQIPAAGGFLLHENTPELARYFEPGREVGVFHSSSDLPKKITRYLGNPDERTRILKSGSKRCHESNYIYDSAARTILDFHQNSVS